MFIQNWRYVQPKLFPTLQSPVRKNAKFRSLFTISAPLLFVFWTIFVGTFSKWELLIGLLVAIVGGVAICIVEHAEDSHFRPRFRDLILIVYVPWPVLQGTYEIVWAAIRDLFGGRKVVSAFRVLRFEAGAVCDPHDTARRVLAVAYTTMTPPSIVLGINTHEKQLVFHEIDESGVPKVTKNLGAVA